MGLRPRPGGWARLRDDEAWGREGYEASKQTATIHLRPRFGSRLGGQNPDRETSNGLPAPNEVVRQLNPPIPFRRDIARRN